MCTVKTTNNQQPRKRSGRAKTKSRRSANNRALIAKGCLPCVERSKTSSVLRPLTVADATICADPSIGPCCAPGEDKPVRRSRRPAPNPTRRLAAERQRAPRPTARSTGFPASTLESSVTRLIRRAWVSRSARRASTESQQGGPDRLARHHLAKRRVARHRVANRQVEVAGCPPTKSSTTRSRARSRSASGYGPARTRAARS